VESQLLKLPVQLFGPFSHVLFVDILAGFVPVFRQHLIFHLYSLLLSMLFSSNRNIFTHKLIPSVLLRCKASPRRGTACLISFRTTAGKLQPSGVPGFHPADQTGRVLPLGHGC